MNERGKSRFLARSPLIAVGITVVACSLLLAHSWLVTDLGTTLVVQPAEYEEWSSHIAPTMSMLRRIEVSPEPIKRVTKVSPCGRDAERDAWYPSAKVVMLFENPSDALFATLDLQRQLYERDWRDIQGARELGYYGVSEGLLSQSGQLIGIRRQATQVTVFVNYQLAPESVCAVQPVG